MFRKNHVDKQAFRAVTTFALLGSLLSPFAASAAGLEEIIVTARKRAESIQTVPLSVTAIGGEQIERSYTPKLEGLDEMAPNVELGKMQFGGGGLTGSIRGVSFAETERTFEPAVGLTIDGVAYGTGTGSMVDLFDIDSVEILRGPQGTLFGRNTMGGTINIRRTKPTGEFGGKVSVGIGNNDTREVKAILNTSIIKDTLALKLSAVDLSNELFTKNLITGKNEDGMDQTTLGFKLLYTPSDDLEVMLSYDNVDDNSRYPGVVNLSQPGNAFCDLGLPGGCLDGIKDFAAANGNNFDDFDSEYSATPFIASIDSEVFTLEINYDISDTLRLTSLTGTHDVKDRLTGEVTGIPDFNIGGNNIPFFYVDRQQTYEQFSQELRVASSNDGAFNYVAGLYYFSSKYGLQPQEIENLGTLIQSFTAAQELDAYAVFMEGYYQMSDDTRLTIGGRYTKEEKTFSRTGALGDGTEFLRCPDPSSPVEVCANPKADWSQFSPRISLDHQINDDMMAYISYSQGFRSGGWSGRAAAANEIGPYDQETLDNYEVGLRSEWLNGTLRLNATAFYSDYQDKQEDITVSFADLNGAVSTSTFVENAASADIKGFELELYYNPTERFRIRSALGILDAAYADYTVNDNGVDVSLLDSRNYRFAPDMTFNVGGDYTIPLASGELIFSSNFKHTDEFHVTPAIDTSGANRDLIDSYSTLDMSLTYVTDRYTLSVYGNDITHEEGRLFRKFDAGAFWFGDQEVGRTFGANLSFTF